MRQQWQSVHKPFGLVRNKAGGGGSGSQTMKGIVSNLRELGFNLEGRGGPRGFNKEGRGLICAATSVQSICQRGILSMD